MTEHPDSAAASGTPDYAAAGLLDGLEGESRAERLRLLERLSAVGVTLEELREAHANGMLLVIGAEGFVGGGNRHTLREIAADSGLGLHFLEELLRASGIALPGPDERVLGPGDVALARIVRGYREVPGLADEDLLEVARALTRGLRPVASIMHTIALRLAAAPGAGEVELAERFISAVAQVAPMLEPLLGESIRLHLREIARAEAVRASELAASAITGTLDVGVCFADLVGFTRAGELLDPSELGEIAVRLQATAERTVQPPVQIVKTLGDGVMLVSAELRPLVSSALALVSAADTDAALPELRAGVAYGPALNRAADWYGRPVNLASRLTDVARPGSVLAQDVVREALRDDGFAWSFAGARRLKGISEPVRLYRVRPAGRRGPR
jgi:adenylate cyclase